MKYYSTNQQSPAVDFREATINGQAPDKGLYFPEKIPVIDPDLISNMEKYSDEEIASRVIMPYTGESIPGDKLMQIVKETISFPIPLIRLDESVFSLELFHGPTLAFKDIGARFMSRCLGYFVKDVDKKVTVLVATSGDTGGAVASGFYNVDGIEVVILYPSGKVSPVQEKQLTTLGKNIHALEIEGTFDDCQQMVKNAFIDDEIKKKRFLTSANSINVARWLPQQFYYFFAYKQWPDKNNPPVISVPSGNFGNICAGLLAFHSGLPVQHFIAACNSNDVIPEFMRTQKFESKKAVPTLSNAMDVGNPSNFIRILEIFNHQFPALEKMMSAVSISDVETIAAISDLYHRYNYIPDPHGAVGWLALKRWLEDHEGTKGIFLETAHPVKFPEAVEKYTGKKVDMPITVQEIMKSEKISIKMKPACEELKNYLL
ncbi:MAG: threonine synthase [Bacteroidota bacterium]|nr:threonine synthase [Bacteroidota bacterium]